MKWQSKTTKNVIKIYIYNIFIDTFIYIERETSSKDDDDDSLRWIKTLIITNLWNQKKKKSKRSGEI